MEPVVIGIDVGQKVDPTAIAVAEVEQRGGETYHVIRSLQRLPLGAPYPDIAARLRAVTEGVRARMAQDEAERMVAGQPWSSSCGMPWVRWPRSMRAWPALT